jgi:hypothetical protein
MKIHTFLKIGWLILGAIVLAVVLVAYDSKPNSDIEQFLIGSMIVISFPIGFLVAGVLSAIYAVLGSCCEITVKTSYSLLIIEWMAFFGAGYLQWFMLLPWAVKKWRAHRAARPLKA